MWKQDVLDYSYIYIHICTVYVYIYIHLIFPGIYHVLSVLTGTTSVTWPCCMAFKTTVTPRYNLGQPWNLFFFLLCTWQLDWKVSLLEASRPQIVGIFSGTTWIIVGPEIPNGLTAAGWVCLKHIEHQGFWQEDWFTHLGDFSFRDDAR